MRIFSIELHSLLLISKPAFRENIKLQFCNYLKWVLLILIFAYIQFDHSCITDDHIPKFTPTMWFQLSIYELILKKKY